MCFFAIFFFNDTPPTEIYTLSLHDALPISGEPHLDEPRVTVVVPIRQARGGGAPVAQPAAVHPTRRKRPSVARDAPAIRGHDQRIPPPPRRLPPRAGFPMQKPVEGRGPGPGSGGQ